MQIQTIQQGFQPFKCKLEAFERDSKQSSANLNNLTEILTIRMQIRSNRMQTESTRSRFEAIECKFESFKRDSNHSIANWKHLNQIRSNRMQIGTIRQGF